MPTSPESADEAIEAIRATYRGRRWRPGSSTGPVMRELRLQHDEVALRVANLVPLKGRAILDVGCGNGTWLEHCCRRWGADPQRCVGVELSAETIQKWQAGHPDSRITLECQPAHEMTFDDESFDVMHQSMMFSSILSADLRARTADRMWRTLRTGGHLLWYDFWINPLNRATVPMRLGEIRRMFPAAQVVYHRRITVAPPLTRVIMHISDGLLRGLERMTLFNTHHLVLLAKVGGCS